MAALAAPCGIVGATGALAAGATGFSNGGGVVLASGETGDGPESLRAGADSAPVELLRYMSLESPNFCSFNPLLPDAACGAGIDFSILSSGFGVDFAATAIFTVFAGATALFLGEVAIFLSTSFALPELFEACFAAEVFPDAATPIEAVSFFGALAGVAFFGASAFCSVASLFEAFARCVDLFAPTGLDVEVRLRAGFVLERFGLGLSEAVNTFFVTFLRAAIGQVSRNARRNHPSTARGRQKERKR